MIEGRNLRITRLDYTDAGTMAVAETDDGQTVVGFDPASEWQGWHLPSTLSLYQHGFCDVGVLRILMGWTRHQAAARLSRPARRAVLRRG